MDWRKVVRGIGKTLITTGLLILLFVVYQLKGTDLSEQRSQASLKRSYEATTTTVPATDIPVIATPAPAPGPGPEPGAAIGQIAIPKINVDKWIVQGTGISDLKKGPGHYEGTPMPGEAGNAAIAGHRTTYGAPFNRLDELAVDDEIEVKMAAGDYLYKVVATKVVKPNDTSVLVNDKADHLLTLTTCNPKYSAKQRLVVQARLDTVNGEKPVPTTSTTAVATADPAPPPKPIRVDENLNGDESARIPAVLWGLLAFAVGFLIWLAGRRWPRWLAYPLGSPLFFVVLFVFFENINRALPANL